MVHVLTGATRPRVVDEHTYVAGEVTFNSALVDVPAGKVLCAGNSVVSAKGDVSVTGRGSTDSDARESAAKKIEHELLTNLGFEARYFGLGEICWIGGEQLCSATSRKLERPQ